MCFSMLHLQEHIDIGSPLLYSFCDLPINPSHRKWSTRCWVLKLWIWLTRDSCLVKIELVRQAIQNVVQRGLCSILKIFRGERHRVSWFANTSKRRKLWESAEFRGAGKTRVQRLCTCSLRPPSPPLLRGWSSTMLWNIASACIDISVVWISFGASCKSHRSSRDELSFQDPKSC